MRLWLVGLHNNNNYGKKLKKLMVYNSSNINKTNTNLSSQIIECKKNHDDDIPNTFMGQVQKCCGAKPVNVFSKHNSYRVLLIKAIHYLIYSVTTYNTSY